MHLPTNRQTKRGRKPKGGVPTFFRLPADLRAFIEEVRDTERRVSISNAGIALLYEAKAARQTRAA